MEIPIKTIFWFCGYFGTLVATITGTFYVFKNSVSKNKEDIKDLKKDLEKSQHFFKNILFQTNGDHNYLSVRAFEKFEKAYILAHKEMANSVQEIDGNIIRLMTHLKMDDNIKRRADD